MSLVLEAFELRRTDGVPLLGPLRLSLGSGERPGLVGESGAGKSLLARACFGALPPGVVQHGGTLRVFGVTLEPGPAREALRPRLGWLPQDPQQGMHPLLSLSEHLALPPRLYRGESSAAALARLGPLLARLRVPGDPAFLGRFPHQISGGQRQRLGLAMAIACDPELLLLDEPTSALDPGVRGDFLDLVLDLQRARGLGCLWITHDLTLAARSCERLVVLYAGQILEAGPTAELLRAPRHPYTVRLLAAARGLPSTEAGFQPAPEARPPGCPFQPRCARQLDSCQQSQPWRGSTMDGVRCGRPLGSAHWVGQASPTPNPGHCPR